MNLYSAYDYLAFVIPGGVVLFQLAVGSGVGISDPGAGAVILLLGAAFLVGHVVAAVAAWFQPLVWGHRPGGRPDPLWGFGYRGPELDVLKSELARRYGAGLTLIRLYQLAYTEIQQVGKDARLMTINSQIAFYRNAAASFIASAVIAVTQALALHKSTVEPSILIAAYVFGAVVFIDRYRVFWAQFGDNVIRGFRILAAEQPRNAPAERTPG